MPAAYPTSVPSFPVAHARPPSAGTAETLVLVALVLQVIGGVILIGAITWFFGFSLLYPYPYAWLAVTAAVLVGAVAVVFLYLAYTFSYQRIQRGDYAGAQGPTLVLGILSLFFGILPGIFYLIGYVKLGDALNEQRGVYGYGPAYGAAPAFAAAAPQQVCQGCGRILSVGPEAFCPHCGRKLGA